MEKWNIRLHLKTKQKQEVMQSQPMQIQRGIFQEDTLSPLLFCITLITLTHKLKRADYGYQVHGTERQMSNILYMDDLKLLGSNEDDLENKIKTVKAISKDINTNLGLEKCARICLKKSYISKQYIYIYIGSTFEMDIKELDLTEVYISI
jgi:hypothetical protein